MPPSPPYVCRRNTTFLCPAENPENPVKHLHIVLTNPSEDGKVVVVNISTARDDSFRDEWECMLKLGDHPFIRHESYVVYREARIEVAEYVERKCNLGICQPLENIGDAVLEKICRVLLQSKRTPLELKEFYEAHHPTGIQKMNSEVFITCAVTGSADTVGKHPAIPVTPEEIANAAIASAEAGAAIVHCHVRDPDSGQGSRDVALYREVVSRIRDSGVDMVINLTAGMGGDYVLNDDADLATPGPGSDLIPPLARLAHVEELLPEICTLDCGSMNFGNERYVMMNVPDHLRAMARRIQELGVRPEIEIFDTGHLWFAKQLIKEGLIDAPPMFQLCLGIPWGATADTAHMKTMADALPDGAMWAGFGIGRMQMPMVAQAVLLGGHVRVGLEDNLYLSKGVFADNAQLVTRARAIVENMGATVLGPQQAREKLKLSKRA